MSDVRTGELLNMVTLFFSLALAFANGLRSKPAKKNIQQK